MPEFPNRFFRDAAQATNPQPFPETPGASLGMLLAADFINKNPKLKAAFFDHARRQLVSKSATRVNADESVTKLLSML